MTDEKFVFVTDVAEKKRTARGAFNKRTHNGKRGGVKFPSDYLTKGERNKMNGEVKSYKINQPITYAEFKSYPTDIKIEYIQNLRKKFDLPDTAIGEMFGLSGHAIGNFCREHGVSAGRRGKCKADYEGFEKWKRQEEDVNEAEVENDTAIIFTKEERPETATAKIIPDLTTEPCLRSHDIDWDEIRRASRDSDIHERMYILEQENAILKAKLEMVYLIFGGNSNDD